MWIHFGYMGKGGRQKSFKAKTKLTEVPTSSSSKYDWFNLHNIDCHMSITRLI